MARASALVLFDIDGTLVRKAGRHHRRALEEAVRRIAGIIVSTDKVPVAGMLDRDIVTAMMREAGVSAAAVRRMMPAIVEEAQRIYARSCPDLRRKVCPGVRTLLARLNRRGARMGLVTGNLTRIGWKKMECAGLREHFDFGAFAERGKDRTGLVRLAMREAIRAGWVDRATPVSLIGDHINDIRAAQANRVRSVAVATGVLSEAELLEHSPDVLVRDLRDLEMECLFGS